MFPRRRFTILAFALLLPVLAIAQQPKFQTPKLTPEDRKMILTSFMAENVFVRRAFPMGTVGLRIVDGRVTPDENEVRQLMADNGPAAKPGDRVHISDVRFTDKGIFFELNGGPTKKKKWYERLQVGTGGVMGSPTGKQDDGQLFHNARGSFVLLGFKDYVPSLTPDQVRELLTPVFDFRSATVAEAFQRALPPKLAQAVKDHKALVGMDREMVTYAKGRPPRRYRDRDAEQREYEEWIYGQPPQEVEFIRFVGEKVARIEIMQVDGEKVVRTENEVGDLSDSVVAQTDEKPKTEEQPARKAPSIMRDGEQTIKAEPGVRQRPRDGRMDPGSGGPQPTTPTSDPNGPQVPR